MIVGAVIHVAQRFQVAWVVLQGERLEERREGLVAAVGRLVQGRGKSACICVVKSAAFSFVPWTKMIGRTVWVWFSQCTTRREVFEGAPSSAAVI